MVTIAFYRKPFTFGSLKCFATFISYWIGGLWGTLLPNFGNHRFGDELLKQKVWIPSRRLRQKYFHRKAIDKRTKKTIQKQFEQSYPASALCICSLLTSYLITTVSEFGEVTFIVGQFFSLYQNQKVKILDWIQKIRLAGVRWRVEYL